MNANEKKKMGISIVREMLDALEQTSYCFVTVYPDRLEYRIHRNGVKDVLGHDPFCRSSTLQSYEVRKIAIGRLVDCLIGEGIQSFKFRVENVED